MLDPRSTLQETFLQDSSATSLDGMMLSRSFADAHDHYHDGHDDHDDGDGDDYDDDDDEDEKDNDNNEKDESSSQAGNSWFWVPWLLPHVGGLVTLSLFHHRLYHPLFSSYHISSSSPIGCSRMIEDW